MPRTSAAQTDSRAVPSTGHAFVSAATMVAENAKRFADIVVVVGPQQTTHRELLKRELIARFG